MLQLLLQLKEPFSPLINFIPNKRNLEVKFRLESAICFLFLPQEFFKQFYNQNVSSSCIISLLAKSQII